VLRSSTLQRDAIAQRYAKDLLRDPFYVWLHNHWIGVVTISWVVFFAGGFVAGRLGGANVVDAVQYGIGIMLWGVVVRTVLTWHYVHAINSVTHSWGYRNYNTNDQSRNNMFMGYIAHGEGWHNNHHADPNSAAHGHKWWEFDLTFWVIRILALSGLAKDIVMPTKLREML
jgi:stearoyl-CoA desaturase (delta-9 desaturase)